MHVCINFSLTSSLCHQHLPVFDSCSANLVHCHLDSRWSWICRLCCNLDKVNMYASSTIITCEIVQKLPLNCNTILSYSFTLALCLLIFLMFCSSISVLIGWGLVTYYIQYFLFKHVFQTKESLKHKHGPVISTNRYVYLSLQNL